MTSDRAERPFKRDTNQGKTQQSEPVVAASSLGTDDEAAGVSSIDDRVARAAEAEKKVGNAPARHRRTDDPSRRPS